MLAFLTDEDFNDHILNARRRLLGLDAIRVEDIGLRQTEDRVILDRAAFLGRLVVTSEVHPEELAGRVRWVPIAGFRSAIDVGPRGVGHGPFRHDGRSTALTLVNRTRLMQRTRLLPVQSGLQT